MLVGRLFVDLIGRAGKYVEAIDRSRRQTERMRKETASLRLMMRDAGRVAIQFAGIAGLGAVIKSTIDAGDELQKLSIQSGASTEALSSLSFGANIAGVTLQEVATSIRFAQRTSVEAAQGMKTYAEAYNTLGINAKEFVRLAPERQLDVLADALMKLQNPAQRTAIAMEVLGRSGDRMVRLLEGGSAGLAAFRAEADRLNLTLSRDQVDAMADVNDSMTRLRGAMHGLANLLVVQLGPAMEAIANFLTATLKPAADFVRNSLELLMQGARLVVIQWIEWAMVTAQLGEKLPLVGEKFKELSAFLRGMSDEVMADFTEEVLDTTFAVQKFAAALGDELPPLREVAAETKALTQEQDQLNDEIRSALSILDMIETPQQRFAEQLREINSLQRAGHLTTAEATAALAIYSRELQEATKASEALGVASRDLATDDFSDLRSSIEGVGRQIEDSIIESAKRGKVAFKDLVSSMIEEVARLTIRRNITGPFVEFGSDALGRAIERILNPTSGGPSGAALAATIPRFGDRRGGLQHGGTAIANQPRLVGEAGPEIFIPGRTGTVVPNEAMGGGSVVINMNVQAMDAASFSGFLRRHRGTLFSIISDARRGSMGRG